MNFIPYHQVKEIIEKEISLYRSNSDQQLPEIKFEREGETTKISFDVDKHANSYEIIIGITEVMKEIKLDGSSNYATLSNERVTITLSDFLKKSISFRTKVVYGNLKPAGEGLTSQDVEAIITAYKVGNALSKRSSPKERLAQLGIRMYDGASKLNWEHLAGYESAKQEIQDTIILPLLNREVYENIARGTRKFYESNRAKAVLFEGPPGTGKTTSARIIAGEVAVPLVYVPLESIVSKWYGESEQRLAEIFDASAELGSSLLFLDEIDALGHSRDQEIHEATRRVLSVLLRKIDGFEANDKTMLIGATNRKEDLDPALLSRFDVTISFPYPNPEERSAIFANYAQHLDLKDLEKLAISSEGLSGRNIKDVCEHTERRWASRILMGETLGELPNLFAYLASLKTKLKVTKDL